MRTKSKSAISNAIVGLVLVTASPATFAATFIANGSFESPAYVDDGYVDIYSGGVVVGTLDNWTVGGNIETKIGVVRGTYFGLAPLDGSQYVAFNGGNTPNGGTLSQSFTTDVGVSYSVSYTVGKLGNNGGTLSVKGEILSASDTVLAQATDFQPTLGWLPQTMLTFTATTTVTTLRYTDLAGTFGKDLALDAVSITTSVPEPVEWTACIALGLVGYAAFHRRSRR